MRAKTQRTSVLLNWTDRVPDQRTYVAFGSRRGSTSLVAGVLRALGLDLGPVGGRTNNEDPDFQAKGARHMRAAIGRRNEQHDVWGWKFPGAGQYLPDLLATLRNPYLVVVTRDPVAAALSQDQRDRPVSRRGPRVALHESAANLATNISLVLASEHPCLAISAERAAGDPEAMVDEVADFLAVPRPDGDLRARLLEYVAPGSYKSFDDFFGDGARSKRTDEPLG